MVMNNLLKAEYLKQFLLKIYHCKKDFELLVIEKKPKTRMGVYIVDKHNWGLGRSTKQGEGGSPTLSPFPGERGFRQGCRNKDTLSFAGRKAIRVS